MGGCARARASARSGEVAGAASVAGAGQAERSLKGRLAALAPLKPLKGPAASVRALFRSLRARHGEKCVDASGCGSGAVALSAACGLS